MSTLSSSSTRAEVIASYQDNASYEEDQSATKAAAFVTAVRLLLQQLPKKASHGEGRAESVELSIETLKQELDDARRWLAQNRSPGGGVLYASFSDFRTSP
jgi:hypothetical protein